MKISELLKLVDTHENWVKLPEPENIVQSKHESRRLVLSGEKFKKVELTTEYYRKQKF